MDCNLSNNDKQLIRALRQKKTVDVIEKIIGKPVVEYLNSLQPVSYRGIIPSHLHKKKGRKRTKPENVKKVKVVSKKQPTANSKEMSVRRLQLQEQRQKKERKRLEDQQRKNLNNAAFEKRRQTREKKIPTRVISLEGTIRVQLNAKTIVWVKPGTDIEKLKQTLKIK